MAVEFVKLDKGLGGFTDDFLKREMRSHLLEAGEQQSGAHPPHLSTTMATTSATFASTPRPLT